MYDSFRSSSLLDPKLDLKSMKELVSRFVILRSSVVLLRLTLPSFFSPKFIGNLLKMDLMQKLTIIY